MIAAATKRRRRRVLSLLLVITLILTSTPTDNLVKAKEADGIKTEQSVAGALPEDANHRSAEQGYETLFHITCQSPGSFNGEIVLKNTGTQVIENWALAFTFSHDISSIWNADIIEHTDNCYIIKNDRSNADITPGSEVRAGFTASWTDEILSPSDIVLCSQHQEVAPERYDIDFQVSSDWGSGFNGSIGITNHSDQPIEHWTLEFDFDHDITSFWDAEMISRENNHYIIKHRSYNAVLQPGQTIVLGFGGGPGNVVTKPSNYSLTFVDIVSDSQEVPSPMVTLRAFPETITKGESTQLVWNSENTDWITIEQNASTATGSAIIVETAVTGGAITVTPEITTTYTATASAQGTDKTATASVTVNVLETMTPAVQFYASSEAIRKGESVTLTWNSGGDRAYLDQGIGIVNPNGSYVVSPEHTTVYTIAVTGENGSTSKQVMVKVLGDLPAQPEGSFGYSYNTLIPEDATLFSYDEERFSVITGTVYSISNVPVEGVLITVEDHPEYGTAYTDPQGGFSIPVEGGDDLTIQYSKSGYLSCMRKVYVPWNEIAVADPVQIIAVDTVDTTVIFDGDPDKIITHRSTPVTDETGTRAMTMVFEGDNRAWILDEDGNDLYPLDTVTVRATEYTTPDSMPGLLPPTSAYTYCAELQVDGVSRVRFEKPVTAWVDNFLGFPVGEHVPVGYLDRDRNVWVPSEDGIVVMLLDTDGDGVADALDTDGDNLEDITDPEQLQGLEDSSVYPPGSTWWRVEVSHFTPYDYNWPMGLPEGAIAPNPAGVAQYRDGMVFYEEIAIPGTDESLQYASDRTAGYKNVITVPVSGASVPDCLESIVVKLSIAGQTFEKTVSPAANRVVDFEWDGLDYLGRRTDRVTTVSVSIGFVYQGVYYSSSQETYASFAIAGGVPLNINTRRQYTVWDHSTMEVDTKARDTGGDSFGNGWTLTSHNKLVLGRDKTLLKGDGTTQEYTGIRFNDTVTYFDAEGQYPYGIAMDAAGNLYATTRHFIVKVEPDGNKTIIAGSSSYGYRGDGGPATEALLRYPRGIDIDASGNIYVADSGNNCVRKIDTDGIITTVAGIPRWFDASRSSDHGSGDNGPALEAYLDSPYDVELDPYGYLYLSESGSHRIRKVSPDGIITTAAGNGDAGFSGDGGRAVNAQLYYPEGITLDAAGNLYIVDTGNGRIRKVDPSGGITTAAGNGSETMIDWVPATESGLSSPADVAVDREGNLYIADSGHNVIRKVYPEGLINTIAGIPGGGVPLRSADGIEKTGETGGERGAALTTPLNRPSGLAVDSAGDLYTTDYGNNRICKITTPPAYRTAAMEEAAYVFVDGDIYYTFEVTGQQLKTVDLATGVVLQEFLYHDRKQLVGIENQFGNRITIERDGGGTPTAILSPDGIRTSLTITEGRLAKVTYPNGADYNYSYSQDGLLTEIRDFNNNLYKAAYDLTGRLSAVEDSEGGRWQYGNTILPTGDAVTTITSAEGLVTTYIESLSMDGSRKVTVREPNGNETVQTRAAGNMNITESLPDGSAFSYDYDLDPVYYTEYLQAMTEDNALYTGLLTERDTDYEDADGDSIPDIITTTVTDGDGQTTTVQNIPEATVTTTTPEGRATKIYYNPSTLLTERADTAGLPSIYYTYDTSGRLVRVQSNERETSFEYNQSGFLSKAIVQDETETTYEYDAIGQVTAIHRADGSSIYQGYDGNGNLTALTTPGDVDYSYEYDKVDSAVQFTAPISGSYHYTYNKDRIMTSATTPGNKTTGYAYDTAGQLEQINTAEGDSIHFTWLDTGLLGSVAKGREKINYSYAGSLVTGETREGILDTSLEYGYNNKQKIEAFTYAGGTADYAYDLDGLLTKSGSYTLDRNSENGSLESIRNNDITISREYSEYGELAESIYRISDSVPFTWSVERDGLGRIAKKTETLDGKAVTSAYTYDELGRLLTVIQDGVLTEEYEYDSAGRRISCTSRLRGVSKEGYAYNGEDQLLSAGDIQYEYDPEGHLTRKTDGSKVTAYEYTSEGELTKVTLPDGSEINYLYDVLGRRTAKQVNGVITEKYLWDETTNLLAVYDGEDNLLMRFEYAGDLRPVSMVKGGETYYLHYDQAFSLRAVSDADGNIVKEIAYDSFGNIIEDTEEGFTVPFRFAGGLYDGDTGLVLFGARDYDPGTGRWIEKDPEFFNGGSSDLYEYCLNNPIILYDPEGTFAQLALAGGGYLATSAVVGSTNFWNPFGWAVLGITVVATVAIVSYEAYKYSKSKSDPYARPGQKKQNREVKEKKKEKNWKGNPNKRPQPPKKHTPGREHRKY